MNQPLSGAQHTVPSTQCSAHLRGNAGALAADKLGDERVGGKEGGRGNGAGGVASLRDIEINVARIAAFVDAPRIPHSGRRCTVEL